jgi:hypothetical protein
MWELKRELVALNVLPPDEDQVRLMVAVLTDDNHVGGDDNGSGDNGGAAYFVLTF